MADEFKQKAEEFKEKAGDITANLAAETKTAVGEVKEEAAEVFQEAKAVFTGQTLPTSNEVGAAGYREQGKPETGPSVASLVLGILSLICALLGWGAVLGLILAIVGTVLGAKARKVAQTGTATAGFVCSIVGIVLNGIGLVCAIACVGAAGILGSAVNNM